YSTVGVLLFGSGLSTWLYAVARSEVAGIYQPLIQAIHEAEGLVERYQREAVAESRRRLAKARKRHNRDLPQAKEKYLGSRAEIKTGRVNAWGRASETYRQLRGQTKERHDTDLAGTTARYDRLRMEIQEDYERDSRQVRERYEAKLAARGAAYEAQWRRLLE